MYDEVAKSTPFLFEEALEKISKGYEAIDNPDLGSLRGYPRIQEDSQINWAEDATNIDKLVKASSRPFSWRLHFLQIKYF